MPTRRLYERINLNQPLVIYHKGKEISGIVKDISENGVGLLFDDIDDSLEVNDVFPITFISELYNEKIVLTGRVKIVRIQKIEEGYIIGCKIMDDRDGREIENFVINKKTELYIKNECEQNYLIGMFNFRSGYLTRNVLTQGV